MNNPLNSFTFADIEADILAGRIKPATQIDPKLFTRCRYCGTPAANNNKGQWGLACSGCKGSLTTRLRSGKYGPTYDKATKERLRATRYDPDTGKWIEGLTRHWYEYDWNKSLSKSGKPRIDYDYVNPHVPITEEELKREDNHER
jgi:hypothetical protein